MLVSVPGRSATVLVAFATSGESPAATMAGKVMSVPPPAIAFMMPPTNAAAAAMTSRPAGTVMLCGDGRGAEWVSREQGRINSAGSARWRVERALLVGNTDQRGSRGSSRIYLTRRLWRSPVSYTHLTL